MVPIGKIKYIVFAFFVLLFQCEICAQSKLTIAEKVDVNTKSPNFHPPHTEQEKKLNTILELVILDEHITHYALHCDKLKYAPSKNSSFEYALEHKWYAASPNRFYKMFSEVFLKSCAKAEKDAVREDCGEIFIPGEMCGLNFNPILCAQNYSEFYEYRTIKNSDSIVLIQCMWRDQQPTNALQQDNVSYTTYRMTTQGGEWVIDGVSCANDGGNFNM